VNALFETVESNLLRNFNIFDEAFAYICTKICGIDVNLEAVTIDNSDSSGLQGVKLSHAFNFSELDIIAILEFMTLIFMNSHNQGISLCCVNNYE